METKKAASESNMTDKSPTEASAMKHRNFSGRSTVSAADDPDRERRQSLRQRGSVAFLKRTGSTATTDAPFERQISHVSSLASGKSLASIRTRLTSVSRSEYHQDLKPSLGKHLNTNLVFTAFIIIFGSSFQFGYNLGVLNNISMLIQDFYRDVYSERKGAAVEETFITVMWSLTTALFIPGGFIGAFLGGFTADKLGRKKTILLSHIFAFLGAALSTACMAAKAPELLMLGRFLCGLNCGFGNCIAPMYLSEIAPFNMRGAFGTLHQLSVTIGIFLSSVFGLDSLLGSKSLWPYLILLQIIPAAVSLIILPLLPDSPRFYLLVLGEREEAFRAMKFFRKCDEVTTDMEEMDTENQQQEDQPQTEPYTLVKLFKSRDLWKPLMVACMLNLIQQFSGINAIFFYSSGIFKQAQIADQNIQYAVVGTNGINVLMTLIAVPLIDMTGRRPLLLLPMLVMIGDLVLITISLSLQAKFTWLVYISILAVLTYVICFAVGLGPIPMMIAAELFRQGPRPKAMAVAGAVNWFCTFIIAMTFEIIQKKCGNYTFVIFLVLMVLFVVFIYFLLPETKNKTFEEIAHEFSPGAPIEVEEMMDDVFDDIPVANDDGEHEEHQLVTINFDLSKNQTKEAVTPTEDDTAKESEVKLPGKACEGASKV
ncbi:hypothetical protein CAPTEDRAFT_219782 [Capitella teleta]|uniref:Major facilitator superfamily (MFS) profile domain-containing protein n=1 Tax=Capitella teleta TaxID=283909 RepID=R7TY95_CAPTE|nr:hypothetical protein CAPTEDRAFT_219782 [Capitella teleta]|eukprot:ELT96391.1 hypothetical protein CAPTEDRAFT_219782 [Capitella teleta]